MMNFAYFHRPSFALFVIWLLIAGFLTQSAPSQAQYGNFGRGNTSGSSFEGNGFENSPYLAFRPLDQAFVERALDKINHLTRRYYGSALKQTKAHDLGLLQQIIDDELISRDDLETAQAMGIALGAVVAQELQLDWIRYSDKQGVSRALRVRHSDQVFFPVSMISRRYRAGLNPNVHLLYKNMAEDTRKARSIYAEE